MKHRHQWISIAALVVSTNVFAVDATKEAEKAAVKAPTKEQRLKMAEMHEKMAACLKSDRTIKECRSEMMKSCEESGGKNGCSMMGKYKNHRHHHHMKE